MPIVRGGQLLPNLKTFPGQLLEGWISASDIPLYTFSGRLYDDKLAGTAAGSSEVFVKHPVPLAWRSGCQQKECLWPSLRQLTNPSSVCMFFPLLLRDAYRVLGLSMKCNIKNVLCQKCCTVVFCIAKHLIQCF